MNEPTNNEQLDITSNGSRFAGRPSKYTPQLVATLLQALELNPSIEAACRTVGINPDTYYTWYKSSREDPNSPYADFSDRADIARNTLVNKAAKSVGNGVNDDPYLALKVLERLDRTQWGKVIDVNQNLNVTGQVNHTHTHQFTLPAQALTPAYFRQIAAGMESPELPEPTTIEQQTDDDTVPGEFVETED